MWGLQLLDHRYVLGDRRHKREVGQAGESHVKEFILILLLILGVKLRMDGGQGIEMV